MKKIYKSVEEQTESDVRLARRNFLKGATAGALSLSLAGMAGSAHAANKRNSKPLIINALGGVYNPNPSAHSGDQQHVDRRYHVMNKKAIDDALASGLSAINITLGYVRGDKDPYETTVNSLAFMDETFRHHKHAFLRVWNAEDILRAKREGKIGIIYGFQNGAMIGDKVQRIDTFSNMGMRVFQLTYNIANQLGDGSMAPENRGLSKLGFEAMDRLHHNNILIDLSHSGEKTCLDAIKAAKGPISMTHTGCRALADLPRNKTDKELRGIAETGGVNGVYFMPFLRESGQPMAEDVIAHMEHAINVCGEDHIGIGTDGGTTSVTDLGAYRERRRKQHEIRQKQGIAAKGERADKLLFIPDMTGPKQFEILAHKLGQRGHSEARIDKILGGNFYRVMKDVWQG